MCDVAAVVQPGRTLFAKNSDRPLTELQLIEGHPARRAGGDLHTTYLTIADAGAAALVGARPEWMWGLEHGVNEHRVAIGNLEVWTVDDPADAGPALTGMDLVRLGLERGRDASHAVDTMTDLLEEHGQGGVANEAENEAYFSSFLVADLTQAWVLETSGRTWVARPYSEACALSNRLSLRTNWTRSSADVPAGADFDDWRHPKMWTGHADVRRAATQANIVERATDIGPEDLVAALRDHGTGPWGRPGAGDVPEPAPRPAFDPGSGEGFSVCLHLRDYQATTSAIVAELPADPSQPARVWMAPASPCVTPFFPVADLLPAPALADTETIRRFADVARRVEQRPDALPALRSALDPLEGRWWNQGSNADAPAAALTTAERVLDTARAST